MNLKREWLALAFGMIVIFIIFGDAVPVQPGGLTEIGNLDTAFGLAYWRLVDIALPIASVVVFLLYGKACGKIRVDLKTGSIITAFLLALILVILDDMFVVVGHPIILPETYWVVARWVYLFVSTSMFFVFGSVCAKSDIRIK